MAWLWIPLFFFFCLTETCQTSVIHRVRSFFGTETLNDHEVISSDGDYSRGYELARRQTKEWFTEFFNNVFFFLIWSIVTFIRPACEL